MPTWKIELIPEALENPPKTQEGENNGNE